MKIYTPNFILKDLFIRKSARETDNTYRGTQRERETIHSLTYSPDGHKTRPGTHQHQDPGIPPESRMWVTEPLFQSFSVPPRHVSSKFDWKWSSQYLNPTLQ